MKGTGVAALLILLAGCAAVTSPPGKVATETTNTTTDFVVSMRMAKGLSAMQTSVLDSRPVAPDEYGYAISIQNKTSDPVTVRQIALEYSTYDRGLAVLHRTRKYDKTIGPGATETVEFWLDGPSHGSRALIPVPRPPTTIEFEGPHGTRTESFLIPVKLGIYPAPKSSGSSPKSDDSHM